MENKENLNRDFLTAEELDKVTGGDNLDPMRRRIELALGTCAAIRQNDVNWAVGNTKEILKISGGLGTLKEYLFLPNMRLPQNEAYDAVMNLINAQ